MSDLAWIPSLLAECDSPYLIRDQEQHRYPELLEAVQAWRARLTDFGLCAGDPVALIGDYAHQTVALLLALILEKMIAIPLAPDAKAERDFYLNTARAKALFELHSDGSWKHHAWESRQDHSLISALKADGEAGIVLFSSGTTGIPKASLLQASRLLSRFEKSQRKPFTTLVFLKLDHIGGINTLFSVLFNAGTAVVGSSRSPESVCAAIQTHRVELLPTTPTFLNMLILSGIYKDYDLSSLRIVTYGTEPMPESTLVAAKRILPQVQLKQTYGLTELGIFPTQSRDDGSTWMRVGGPGIELDIRDGCLWIRSQSAMRGYLNAPQPFDAEGWYNTGDQVERDGAFLRILGRREEIINVGGEKVYPAEVESVLLEMPGVLDALVKGKSSPVTGQTVSAILQLSEPTTLSELRARVQQFCQGRLDRFKIPTHLKISEASFTSERFKKSRSNAKESQ